MKLFLSDHWRFKLAGCLIISFLLLPLPELHALESMNEDEMSEVGAAEGLIMDIVLNLEIDEMIYRDGDGAGSTAGVIQIGNSSPGFELTDGAGGAANLNGVTVDSDGSGLSTGAGAIVLGGPSSTFTMASDEVILGGGASAFEFDVNGIDVSNTNVKVGAN